MSYRTTPSFAVGGVAWFDEGLPQPHPPGGWRCYHCGEHFDHWRKARKHFGDPGSKRPAACLIDGEAVARQFHETYERLAPSFGYETRPDTKAFDPSTPNGRLMIAVCSEVAADLLSSSTTEGKDP